MVEDPAYARQPEAELNHGACEASGKMNSRDAAELLRATQIAGAMLKPEKKMLQPAKGNPAEALALTPKRNGVNAVEKRASTPWKKRG